VVFARRISSNAGHSFLNFSIDGNAKAAWSGNLGWKKVRFPLTAGTHTLRWEYKKDAAVAMGSDAAWIDDVSYPASVQTRVVGTTAKATCLGATPGTLSLMTIPNPTCNQVTSYLAWLKVIRMKNFTATNKFSDQINGIEVANKTVQDAIGITSYVMKFRTANSFKEGLDDATKSLTFKLAQDYVPIVNCSGAQVAVCDEATGALYNVIEYGFDVAILGTSAAAATTGVQLYAIEKSLATYYNLMFAWDANTLTKKMNTAQIADFFLDEFYKNGMNLAVMRTKYGVTSTALADLIDPFATAKGYSQTWWGTYYKTEVINIINSSRNQVTDLVNSVKQ
jgi:hypothetical protein